MNGLKLNAISARNGALLLLCLVVLPMQHVDAIYTMNETCQYYGNGYIADSSNCQGWGYCQNGALAGTGLCNPGFLYDSYSGTCKYTSEVRCRTNVTDVCSTLTSPQIIMNPNNCQQFCQCSSTTQPDCGLCPTNQIFDPQKQACVWDTKGECPADSVCRLVPNNKFVSDPTVCGGYLRCELGVGIPGTCNSGYGFNPLTGYCESTFTCAPGEGAGVDSNLPANPAACSAYTDTTLFVADDQTCFGYYTCTSATGPGTWSKCPFGTHFNPTAGADATGACVTPYTFACTEDRCGNLDLSFVNTVNTGCTEYNYCINQTTVQSGNLCSDINSEYQYFNEYTGACMNTNPDFAVCSSTS